MIGSRTHGHGGQTIVLLNDWLGDHRNYDPVIPYLSEDCTWVFADLRGYGLSKDLDGEHTLEEAVADVIALVDDLQLASFHLVGHSMSSLVAQQVATTIPERVHKLVLVGSIAPTGMHTPDPVIGWLEQVAMDPAMRREQLGPRMAERNGPGWADFKLERWADSAHPEAVRDYVRMYSTCTVTGSVRDGLPVLAIVGRHDAEPFSPQTVKQGLTSAYPDLTLVECEAGHYPMQETPVAFAAALQRFLHGDA